MSASSSQREIGGNNGRQRRRRRRGRGPAEAPPPAAAAAGHNHNNNGVWPEPFLEALATQVAIDASQDSGRLVAADALSTIFQVCSTWRAVSRSDRLWQRLTHLIWGRDRLLRDTWRDEFVFLHRTASNFRAARYFHTLLDFDATAGGDPPALLCRSLALSDTHLAAGFGDGTVRLFLLRTRRLSRTLRPRRRDRLGPFSRAVSGIVLPAASDRLAFASLDGDVHVAALHGGPPPRSAVAGDAFRDGALVSFSGSDRWWVGLYAGVAGRAFHVWDALSEEPVYVGGSLTDPETVMGWHQLTELTGLVGRVRVSGLDSAVACTGRRVIVFDLVNGQLVLREEEEHPRGLIVASVDASSSAYVVVDGRRGDAIVRRVDTLEGVCGFEVGRAQRRGLMGCMNEGYALMCAGCAIRVWEVERVGQYLYTFRERVGDPSAMVASDRYVALYTTDTSLHLWDFGPHR